MLLLLQYLVKLDCFMKNRKIMEKKYSAMSLIETLVYIGIFGVMFAVIIQYFIITSDSIRSSQSRVIMQHNSIFLIQALSGSFAGAEGIDDTGSALDNSNSILILEMADGSTRTFWSSDQRVMMTDSITGQDIALTQRSLDVSSFTLNRIEDSEGVVIGVEMVAVVANENFPDDLEYIEKIFLIN